MNNGDKALVFTGAALPPYAQALFDRLHGHAKNITAAGVGHVPILFQYVLIDGQARPVSMLIVDMDIEQRGAMLRRLSAGAERNDVYAYVDEAWITTAEQAAKTGLSPKDDPTRLQAVVFTLFGRDWEATAACEIQGRELLKGNLAMTKSNGIMSPGGER